MTDKELTEALEKAELRRASLWSSRGLTSTEQHLAKKYPKYWEKLNEETK